MFGGRFNWVKQSCFSGNAGAFLESLQNGAESLQLVSAVLQGFHQSFLLFSYYSFMAAHSKKNTQRNQASRMEVAELYK